MRHNLPNIGEAMENPNRTIRRVFRMKDLPNVGEPMENPNRALSLIDTSFPAVRYFKKMFCFFRSSNSEFA